MTVAELIEQLQTIEDPQQKVTLDVRDGYTKWSRPGHAAKFEPGAARGQHACMYAWNGTCRLVIRLCDEYEDGIAKRPKVTFRKR